MTIFFIGLIGQFFQTTTQSEPLSHSKLGSFATFIYSKLAQVIYLKNKMMQYSFTERFAEKVLIISLDP